jgi:hypothetical protein
MSITINPNVQTNALGSFVLESDGVITGTAYPDPATRFALAGGILSPNEVLPLWGGLPINELVPTSSLTEPRPELGGVIVRAAADAEIIGFSVFDQNYAAVNTPQSPVPQTAPGGFVSFYRLGSGARIAVEIDPALALEGLPVNSAVGWDYVANRLIAGAATPLPIRVLRVWPGNCMAPLYDGGPPTAPGFLTWNRNAAAAIILI